MAGTVVADKWQNGDGTENYKCRAWVNFNGTGTVAIRASGNVSSITDNGVGNYTVNFTTAMPDNNYTSLLVVPSTNISYLSGVVDETKTISSTTIAISMLSYNASLYADKSDINIAIFR